MTKKLLDIAAEIIQAQASVGQMTPTQIEEALIKTFSTLQKMQKAEEKGLFLDVAAIGEGVALEGGASLKQDPKSSIQDDKITCLECGTQMRQLTARHLSAHGLTPREYKKKWGFSFKQPLSAKSLTKARSKAAKKRGLPENLVKFLEQKKQEKAMAEQASATTESGTGSSPKPMTKRRPAKQV
ncbi:MucR family transcriptional regulator [Syntrophobacter fumaroxidans]|uniref:Transcriptional regulator, MucR family n=1 Tax=Syntrophobacter fumaroxidans (strain DSM 10017 / MPOB) TaxID=335543 RepID=A0LFK2_SYNFM|nr:MucR family transcriptional regulator [Syntrophobacter fumaroxidans]ABK16204.1 transcriptional regulator, MucR family [Syntrophobacter fumaroxidans MPOB]